MIIGTDFVIADDCITETRMVLKILLDLFMCAGFQSNVMSASKTAIVTTMGNARARRNTVMREGASVFQTTLVSFVNITSLANRSVLKKTGILHCNY